jgi:hypothetical protein
VWKSTKELSVRKFAIGASIFAVGYLLFHPAQPSHYIELKDEPVGKIQTTDPNHIEVEPEVVSRDPSGKQSLGRKRAQIFK